MRKRKVLLGMLAVMIVALGGFCCRIPSVFASEVTSAEVSTDEAGTYEGGGYYRVGDNAILKATMNPGYSFDKWISVAEDGAETELSTSTEYSLVVSDNINIKPVWHKIAYMVSVDGIFLLNNAEMEYLLKYPDEFNSGAIIVSQESKTESWDKDKIYTLVNNEGVYSWIESTDEASINMRNNSLLGKFDIVVSNTSTNSLPADEEPLKYYNEEVKLEVKRKTGIYVYDVTNSNIFLNGTSMSNIASSTNIMNITSFITNNQNVDGFAQYKLEIRNIKDNINMTASLEMMYKLTFESANEIAIDKIFNLIAISNYYSSLNTYEYLFRASKAIDVKQNPNITSSVYQFVQYLLNGDSQFGTSISKYLTQDSVLKLKYEKIPYEVNFVCYEINDSGFNQVLTTSLYSIPSASLTAGASLEMSYNEGDKRIIVSGTQYARETITGAYAYIFKGFAISDNIKSATEYIYTMSDTSPAQTEIQLIFERKEYNLTIELLNADFFPDVVYNAEYLNTAKLNYGTNIKFTATSDRYEIVGWSLSDDPSTDGYLAMGNIFEYTFTPNEGVDELKIYIEAQYKYATAKYALSADSIKENFIYDIVKHDTNNSLITFSSSKEGEASELVVPYTGITNNEDGSQTISPAYSQGGTNLGDVKLFSDNTMQYGGNLIAGERVESKDGVDTYKFEKYTYFGELLATIVEKIEITNFDTEGGSATFTLTGTRYSSVDRSETPIAFTFTKTLTDKGVVNNENKYEIKFPYSNNMFVYKKDSAYTRLELNGAVLYYDETTFSFVPKLANNTLDVEVVYVKSSDYYIELGKLLPDYVVLYQTKSIDINLYELASLSDGRGTLTRMDVEGYDTIVTQATAEHRDNILANYTSKAARLLIQVNKSLAYSTAEIDYTIINAEGSNDYTTIDEISAIPDDTVIITIKTKKLTSAQKAFVNTGYELRGFEIYGEALTLADIVDGTNSFVKNTIELERYDNHVTLTFIMRTNSVNSYLYINFEAIEYTLTIVDENGDALTTDSNGVFELKSNNNNEYTEFSSGIITIENTYVFRATAKTGYYISNAYMNMSDRIVSSLIKNNESTDSISFWELNSDEFIATICNNAEQNQVTLFLTFTLHTYTIKVYYEVEANSQFVSWPSLTVNDDSSYSYISFEEEVGGVKTGRRVVIIDLIKHGSNTKLRINPPMTGMYLEKWYDQNGTALTNIIGEDSYNVNNLTKNIIYTVKFKFNSYEFKFVSLDMEGQQKPYGSGYAIYPTGKSGFSFYDTISYNYSSNQGYVFKEIYYYNQQGDKMTTIAEKFIPANYRIDRGKTVNIYLVFDAKQIVLTIKNQRADGGADTDLGGVANWLDYSVVRVRDDVGQELTGEYTFKPGDKLILDITPIPGVALNKVAIGGIEINDSVNPRYNINKYNIVENGTIIGIGYKVEVNFDTSIVAELDENTNLINFVRIRKYRFEYTYNFIDYGFGVKLLVNKGELGIDGSWTTGEDEAFVSDGEFAFNSLLTFTCARNTLQGEFIKKFTISGFRVAGVEHLVADGVQSYTLSGTEAWSKVAINRLNAPQAEQDLIQVVLILVPKITLEGEDAGSGFNNEYEYTVTYNGTEQGLVRGTHIIVEDDFDVIVTYTNVADSKVVSGNPKNAGTYNVEIEAVIAPGAVNEIKVKLNSKVTYIIEKKVIEIKTSFNALKPFEKIYDGTRNADSKSLVAGIVLDGVCTGDKIVVDTSTLRAMFLEEVVNPGITLYDINVLNINLIDNNTKLAPTNYIVLCGTSTVFPNIGKILPRPLRITGFIPKNRVYMADDYSVTVDIDGIVYDGKLATDSTQIETQNLKFSLIDNTIGLAREVVVDWSEALVGADSRNYSVEADAKYIDIYPYEITFELKNYGTFKIVDQDRMCLIPISARLIVERLETHSTEYREMYSLIEPLMVRNEKLKHCYKVALMNGSVEQLMPEGLYIYLPKVKKITQIHQLVNDSEIIQVDGVLDEDFIVIKTTKGNSNFSIVVDATVLPLWAIILIITGAFLGVGIVVVVFVIVRRRAKLKYSRHDKI